MWALGWFAFTWKRAATQLWRVQRCRELPDGLGGGLRDQRQAQSYTTGPYEFKYSPPEVDRVWLLGILE